MIIVDSHCHLDLLLQQQDFETLKTILVKAREADVRYLHTICTRLDTFKNIIVIAEKYPDIFASVGVHPNEAMTTFSHGILLELSQHQKVISLGETGLDYFFNQDKKHHKIQQESFIQHIIASQKNKLPVVIHTRSAEEDTLAIIKEYKNIQEFSGLIHCFTSSKDFARKVLDLGLYISISGIVTFKKSITLQEVVKFLPIDKILVETDAPYLSPVPKRGKTNEPSYIKYTIEHIAKIKDMNIDMVAEHTTNNFFNIFSKAVR